VTAFTWQDGERTVRFGRGALADAGDLLGTGYLLLTTPRASAMAPALAEAAADVREVGPGRVDDLAAALLDDAPGDGLVVALGGGRVIDTAKAIGACLGRPVGAVPTTLSAAEMTRIHRLPPNAPAGTEMVRPKLVLNDPDLCASQPEPELAASAANSLSHAIEGPVTPRSSPVPSLAAEEARRLTDAAYLVEDEPVTRTGREQLALAALLSGSTIDSTGYGLHHVMSQTLVREAGAGHGPANCVLLQHTIGALERRFPGAVDPDGTLAQLARKLARRSGATTLGDLGVTDDQLVVCARVAAQRPQLALTPPAADEAELLELYRAAL
jgi:alcohol dehydrogenase class IV